VHKVGYSRSLMTGKFFILATYMILILISVNNLIFLVLLFSLDVKAKACLRYYFVDSNREDDKNEERQSSCQAPQIGFLGNWF